MRGSRLETEKRTQRSRRRAEHRKKDCLSASDEGHAPSLSDMFSEILQVHQVIGRLFCSDLLYMWLSDHFIFYFIWQKCLFMHWPYLSFSNVRQRTSSTAQQLDVSEVPISRSTNPHYWRNNKGRCPDPAKLTLKYLSAPCTSTDSERLFSAAAHILDEKRNRLHRDNAEKLLFIKKNLPLYPKK